MTIYTCIEEYAATDEHPAGECWFAMLADMSEASAGLWFSYDAAAWQSTPHQTADACHDAARAAELVAEYAASCGGDESPTSVRIIQERAT